MNRIQAAVLPAALAGCFAIIFLAFRLPSPLTSIPLVSAERSAQVDNAIMVDDTTCLVSQSFPITVIRWCELISVHAAQAGLEPDLVAALMLQESGGDPLAYSSNGAVGLLQVMPSDGLAAEFICTNGPCFAGRPSRAELEDPDFNLSYATSMLANLVNHYGSLREALLHYGPIGVGYSYADTVLQLWDRYTHSSG